MNKVKFNVVFGAWEWKQGVERRGMILLLRKWKTAEEILMLNEVQKVVRRLVGQ